MQAGLNSSTAHPRARPTADDVVVVEAQQRLQRRRTAAAPLRSNAIDDGDGGGPRGYGSLSCAPGEGC